MLIIRSILRKVATGLYSSESFKERIELCDDDDYIPTNENKLVEEGVLTSMVIAKRKISQPSFLGNSKEYKKVVDELNELKIVEGVDLDIDDRERFNKLLVRLIFSINDTEEKKRLARYLKELALLNTEDERSLDGSNQSPSFELQKSNIDTESINSVSNKLITIIPYFTTLLSTNSSFSGQNIQEAHTETGNKKKANKQSFIDEEGFQLILSLYAYLEKRIVFNKELVTKFLNLLIFFNLLILNTLKFCLNYLNNPSISP